MLKQKWLSLLKTNLRCSIQLMAAFGAPMVFLTYIWHTAERPSWYSLLAVLGSVVYLTLPFAIYRATTGFSAGLSVTLTLREYRQVLRYLALLFVPSAVAYVASIVLFFIIWRVGPESPMWIAGAARTVLLTAGIAYVRYRYLVVPPMLVATGVDRKTAAKTSARIVNQPGVLAAYLLMDGIPIIAVNLLWFFLPPSVGFWLQMGVIVVTRGLSALLASAVWALSEDATAKTDANDP